MPPSPAREKPHWFFKVRFYGGLCFWCRPWLERPVRGLDPSCLRGMSWLWHPPACGSPTWGVGLNGPCPPFFLSESLSAGLHFALRESCTICGVVLVCQQGQVTPASANSAILIQTLSNKLVSIQWTTLTSTSYYQIYFKDEKIGSEEFTSHGVNLGLSSSKSLFLLIIKHCLTCMVLFKAVPQREWHYLNLGAEEAG